MQVEPEDRLPSVVVVYAAVSVVLSLGLFALLLTLADVFVQAHGLSRRFYGSAAVFVGGIALLVAVLALPARLTRRYRVARRSRPSARTRTLAVDFLGIVAVQCALLAALAVGRLLIFLPIIRAADGLTAQQVVDTFLPPPFPTLAIGGGALALLAAVSRLLVARRHGP